MTVEPLRSDYANDPEMATLIDQFLDSLAATCRQLEECLAAGDHLSVRRIGHQMKGAGAGYGYPLLTDVGAALERAADADSAVTANVRSQAQHFIHVCARACAIATSSRP